MHLVKAQKTTKKNNNLPSCFAHCQCHHHFHYFDLGICLPRMHVASVFHQESQELPGRRWPGNRNMQTVSSTFQSRHTISCTTLKGQFHTRNHSAGIQVISKYSDISCNAWLSKYRLSLTSRWTGLCPSQKRKFDFRWRCGSGQPPPSCRWCSYYHLWTPKARRRSIDARPPP